MLGETVPWDAWGHPLANASTRVLADGYRFVFAGMKGDQQYVKKALAFSTSWVSERMCYVCEAGHDMGPLCCPSFSLHLRNVNVILTACAIVLPCKATQSGPLMYTHHGRDAAHRSTLLSDEDFLRNAQRSPFLLLPGLSASRVWPDILHVLDLSLAPEAAACVAWQQLQANLFQNMPELLMTWIEALLELTKALQPWPGLD